MNPVQWNPWPEGDGAYGLYLPRTAGPSLLESAEVLDAIMAAIPHGGRFLELGTWTGATAAWIAEHRRDVHLLAIDSFVGPPGTADFRAVLAIINLHRLPNVQLYAGDSADFDRLAAADCWDTVLVDADHREPGCYADLCRAERWLREGGLLLVHDVGNPYHTGVTSAVARFVRERPWQIVTQIASLATLRRTA